MHALITSGGLSGRLPGNRYSRAQRKIPLVEELFVVRDNWCSSWEFACYPTVAQSYIVKKPTLESKRGHKMHEIAKEKSVRVSENASAARAGPCKVLKALQDGPGKRYLLMIGDKNFRIFKYRVDKL